MGGLVPSLQVVESVADKEGVAPAQLTPPLYETIDPDALDALFEPSLQATSMREFTFEYSGYEVHVLKNDTPKKPVRVEVNPLAESHTDSEADADSLEQS